MLEITAASLKNQDNVIKAERAVYNHTAAAKFIIMLYAKNNSKVSIFCVIAKNNT